VASCRSLGRGSFLFVSLLVSMSACISEPNLVRDPVLSPAPRPSGGMQECPFAPPRASSIESLPDVMDDHVPRWLPVGMGLVFAFGPSEGAHVVARWDPRAGISDSSRIVIVVVLGQRLVFPQTVDFIEQGENRVDPRASNPSLAETGTGIEPWLLSLMYPLVVRDDLGKRSDVQSERPSESSNCDEPHGESVRVEPQEIACGERIRLRVSVIAGDPSNDVVVVFFHRLRGDSGSIGRQEECRLRWMRSYWTAPGQALSARARDKL
jgi:hypothetical protein